MPTPAHDVAPKKKNPYQQANPKYRQDIQCEAIGDPAWVLPEADEQWSTAVSGSEKFNPSDYPAAEARQASGAHDPEQTVGETEQTTTGAIGVWAIAGPI